ncbi:hypothetical protein TNCV_3040041 [Trichonephila clavipes]|nr:hypothetical protein TNCV_3040041 [Trichonephila clavipes]
MRLLSSKYMRRLVEIIVGLPSRRNYRVRQERCSVAKGVFASERLDFFPEEDTTMSYSGFESEPTRLQAEGYSHHTGWATLITMSSLIGVLDVGLKELVREVEYWVKILRIVATIKLLAS